MAKKSYLTEGLRHADKIQEYFDEGGPVGHSQAEHHYNELRNCYRNASHPRDTGEGQILNTMFVKAGEQMKIMKQWAQDHLVKQQQNKK
jgi:hypothetical protein